MQGNSNPCNHRGRWKVAMVTSSLHERLVCKHLQTTHQAVVKLFIVKQKPEMENLCRQIKSCAFWNVLVADDKET